MKSLLTIVLLAGFVSIAVFGVFGMHVGMQNHDSKCIAALARGTDCPKQSSSLGFLTFHLDAYKGFSLATLGGNVMSGFLAMLASLFFLGLALFSPHLLIKLSQLAFFRYRFRNSFYPPQQQEFTRWLALHENSPAVF